MEGVIKFSSLWWGGGGRKNTAGEFSEIYDPPIPKKMIASSCACHPVVAFCGKGIMLELHLSLLRKKFLSSAGEHPFTYQAT